MKVGIVGLPNAGKSTLFNALTRAGAEVAAYPFTTVDPNQSIVPIPDERLEPLAIAVKATATVPDTISFVDIAGLVRGAHQGEGLGNQFLAHIRETDAIVHVVRCFEDGQVAHPDGRVDPAADIETVETELVLADLEQAERRHERVARQAKSHEREAVAEAEWLATVVDALRRGKLAASVAPPADAAEALATLGSITAKPVLFVANVGEESLSDDIEKSCAAVVGAARERGTRAVAVSARLEAELAELGPAEAAEMRAELGLGESGLERVIHGAFRLLDLIVFYTGHEGSEATARSIKRGATAREAAGKVHTDMQTGFVRAEVIKADDLIAAGSYAAAREAGLIRVEGRDYVVQDGDSLTIKFTS